MSSEQCQKSMLVQSMQKLIKYISLSKKNQIQIFESLSQNDIKKIIMNFSDKYAKLRKLSLTLFGMLLNNNLQIKYKVCERIAITPIPGKVCLYFKTDHHILSNSNKLSQIFTLLRLPVQQQNELFLIWIINLRKDVLKIDYISPSALSYIDPLDHIIGFILNSKQIKQIQIPTFSFIQTSNSLPGGIHRKPQSVPMQSSQRISSNSTQFSNRFSRTSQPKNSIKYSLRNSSAKDENSPYKPRYLSINQGLKSERVSPQRQNFQFQMKSSNLTEKHPDHPYQKKHKQNDTQLIKLDNKLNEVISYPIQKNLKKRIIYQPIIHNTNIYIQSPINTLRLSQNPDRVQKDYREGLQNHDLTKNSTKNSITNNQLIGYQKRNEAIEHAGRISQPSRRPYERITHKEQSKGSIQQKFNINQYRQYLNGLSTNKYK